MKLSLKIALHPHREPGGHKGVPKDENLDVEQSRRPRHSCDACVSYVDAQVGKLLIALKRLGLEQNTIVVIWGAHGFALGETNRWCKATNFELDTRVPLLIRTPNLAHPGSATDSLVEIVDLYTTLAAFAGKGAPANLDGRSFLPLLKDPQAPDRNTVLSQFDRPWTRTTPEVMGYSIRTKNASYTRWIDWQSRETIAEELHDYSGANEDSGPQTATLHAGYVIEQQNIARSHPDLLQRMNDQMDRELAS